MNVDKETLERLKILCDKEDLGGILVLVAEDPLVVKELLSVASKLEKTQVLMSKYVQKVAEYEEKMEQLLDNLKGYEVKFSTLKALVDREIGKY